MFQVNFEKSWHLFLEFLLLTLNKELFAENTTKIKATQNDHCEKKNTTQKHSNPRKQNQWRRNLKCIEKAFY